MVGIIGTLVAGFGGSSLSARNVLTKSADHYRDLFTKQPEVKREIDYFRAKIGSIKSTQDLVDDQRLLKFLLTGFGLESQTFARAFVRKVLDEGYSDSKAMANKIVDPKYRELTQFVDIEKKGVANFADAQWVDRVVDRYVTAAFEIEIGETNPNLRLAFYFDRKAKSALSWYNILGDRALMEVARKGLGFPDATAQMDIDKQVTMFESKFDIKDLRDPVKRAKLIDNFLVRADAENSSAALASNPVLTMMQSAPLSGYRPIIGMDASLISLLQR